MTEQKWLSKVVPAALLSATLGVASCGKKDKDKNEPAPAQDNPGVAPGGGNDEPEAPPTMASIGTAPGAILLSLDGAVTSLGAGAAGLGGEGAALRLAGDEGPLGCHEETNEPVDLKDASKNGPEGWMRETDQRYGVFKLVCLLNGGTENSTTIRGAYFMPKVFMCAVSQMPELVFDGVERDVELPITKACFGSLVDDPDTGIKDGDKVPIKAKLSSPAVVAGWDYTIEIAGQGFKYRLNFKAEAGKSLAFSSYQSGQQSFGDDFVSLSADLAAGELRYVYRRDITDCDGKSGADLATCFGAGDDDQWQGTVHVALLAKGTMGADASFTDLTDVDAAHMRAFANTDHEYSASLFTARGSLTAGVTQRAYNSNGNRALADFLKANTHGETSAARMCFKHEEDPVAGLCAGNAGLRLASDDDTVFFILPADTRHPRHTALWESSAPLAFPAVTLSDVGL